MYYRTQLQKKLNDVKGTWSFLNKVINNINRRTTSNSTHKGNYITDKEQLQL